MRFVQILSQLSWYVVKLSAPSQKIPYFFPVLRAKNEIFYTAHSLLHICWPYVGTNSSSNPMQSYIKCPYLFDLLIDCGIFCTVNELSKTNGLSAYGPTGRLEILMDIADQ